MARYKHNITGIEIYAYRIGDEPVPFWAMRFMFINGEMKEVAWLINYMDGTPISVICHSDKEKIIEFERNFSLVGGDNQETANVNPRPSGMGPLEVVDEYIRSFSGNPPVFDIPVQDLDTEEKLIVGSKPNRRSNEEVTSDLNSDRPDEFVRPAVSSILFHNLYELKREIELLGRVKNLLNGYVVKIGGSYSGPSDIEKVPLPEEQTINSFILYLKEALSLEVSGLEKVLDRMEELI